MAERIRADEVRRRMDAGSDMLFICAYDDEQRCRDTGVESYTSMSELRAQGGRIAPDRELIFFCA